MAHIHAAKLVVINGRTYTLPRALVFASNRCAPKALRATPCQYDVIGFRAPKAGEYFLNGTIVQAYYAEQDLTTSYIIARPHA
jgi:hypothetical protein